MEYLLSKNNEGGLFNMYSRNMHNYSKRVDTEVKLQQLVKLAFALGPMFEQYKLTFAMNVCGRKRKKSNSVV